MHSSQDMLNPSYDPRLDELYGSGHFGGGGEHGVDGAVLVFREGDGSFYPSFVDVTADAIVSV
ncbi:MAG: hypothetical protein GY926_00205, partial [bacterium]|nr:hypothetical protein [bacterium]